MPASSAFTRGIEKEMEQIQENKIKPEAVIERGKKILVKTLEQFRARERDHEDRQVPRPLEQVVHEVDETAVCMVEVLEHHDHGRRRRAWLLTDGDRDGRGRRSPASTRHCRDRKSVV